MLTSNHHNQMKRNHQKLGLCELVCVLKLSSITYICYLINIYLNVIYNIYIYVLGIVLSNSIYMTIDIFLLHNTENKNNLAQNMKVFWAYKEINYYFI